MKNKFTWITVLFLALLMGCVPTRYAWSPDGKWMTVISDDGLRLADAEGNLLPSVIPGVNIATWFADSQHLAVERDVSVNKFDDLARYLSPEQTKMVIESAGYVRDAALAYDWSNPEEANARKFGDFFADREKKANRDPNRYADLGVVVAMYVRDHADAELRRKVPAKLWAEAEKLNQPLHHIEIYNVDEEGLALSQRSMVILADVRDLRVSPRGGAMIVAAKGDGQHATDLWLARTDIKSEPVKLVSGAAWYPDWSADGRYVVFISTAVPAHENEAQLGTVSRIKVLGDDGNYMQTPPAHEELVGLVFSEVSRVRCTKDGRIIFATAQVTLPCTPSEMPQRPQLFAITPDKQNTVAKLLAPGAFERVGDSAQYFELSPDATKASIPDSSGKVFAVDLSTGEVRVAQDQVVPNENQQAKLLTVPQWRSNDELTLMSVGEDGRPAVALWSWSKQSKKILSGNWPVPSIHEKIPATQPANKG